MLNIFFVTREGVDVDMYFIVLLVSRLISNIIFAGVKANFCWCQGLWIIPVETLAVFKFFIFEISLDTSRTIKDHSHFMFTAMIKVQCVRSSAELLSLN